MKFTDRIRAALAPSKANLVHIDDGKPEPETVTTIDATDGLGGKRTFYVHRPDDTIITWGCFRDGQSLRLTTPDDQSRGVKIISMSSALSLRYLRAEREWEAVQDELLALPQSLQPRKRSRKSVVENPVPSEITSTENQDA